MTRVHWSRQSATRSCWSWQNKRPNHEDGNRRKVKNTYTGAPARTDRAHAGPHRWGPVKRGGGGWGQIQFRQCVAAGVTWTGRPNCPHEQWRPFPRPGLNGRPVIPQWQNRKAL